MCKKIKLSMKLNNCNNNDSYYYYYYKTSYLIVFIYLL